MEAIESIDRECAALGGLFQQVVNDLKTGVPHYEDFISKAAKLHGQLKSTILALGSFLDTFQKIADAATNTKGATREIGACLTRIVIRHKAMEARMKTLCSALLDCLILPMQDKMEDWKKIASGLDKDHSKEFKKLRSDLKKKVDNNARLMKKNKKAKGSDVDPKVEQSLAEVTKHARHLHEVEKSAVRRILIEERSRYCTFIACLKPVLGEEVAMVSELQQLEEVMKKLEKHTEDPFKLPEASEQVLSDIKTVSGGVVFRTPPSSPSSLGSRKSSMCSISSAGSSSGGSSNSPSHQANMHRQNRQGVCSLVGPMRLSSISSQDSGFTSQDTLFLRPGSPTNSHMRNNKTPDGSDQDLSSGGSGGSTPGVGGCPPNGGWPGLVSGMPGPPLSDRPHTISSAYEKGHQRPALQPYTFNPPDRTIIEEDERPASNPRSEDFNSHRPPVPQRCISLDRPSLPTKTPAAMTARERLAAVEGAATGVPNFNSTHPDMVVPQPVYMNMSDLAHMSAARNYAATSGSAEDGPDLKTPTAEDLSGLYGCTSEAVYDQHHQMQQQQQGQCADPNGRKGGLARPLNGRTSLARPNSYTNANQHEVDISHSFVNQIGVELRSGTLLRRSMSHAGPKPPPPPVRLSSASEEDGGAGGGADRAASNNTTPRGSMEFLPPPPPHLLHSDDDEPMPPPPSNETPTAGSEMGGDNKQQQASGEVITARGMSVADSIRELQRRQSQQVAGAGQRSSSPATLRRVQSMSGPPGHHPHHLLQQQLQAATPGNAASQDRSHIMAKLDAALAASPRPRAASPAIMAAATAGNNNGGGVEQIYAPVAALQQKIAQQHQNKLAHGHTEPGMVPHPPGPTVILQQQQQHNNSVAYHNHAAAAQQQNNGRPPQQQQYNCSNNSPEGEQYGFGMQFQLHSKNFYSQQQQHQAQQYKNPDQFMQDLDPMLGQRPHPPDINGHPGKWQQQQPHASLPVMHYNNYNQGNGMPPAQAGAYPGGHCEPQSAMRVRQWIETRTVSDVRAIRPVLNQEIQKGFSLRKTNSVNDRSQPKFY